MVEVNNPSVSPILGRALGLVLCVGGVITGWLVFAELDTSSKPPSEPWIFYSILGFLAIVILIAVVQGARMLFARRPGSMRLPKAVIWFGVVLLIGSAALQTFFLITQPDIGDPWQVVLGLGGALGAVQLMRKRSRGGESD